MKLEDLEVYKKAEILCDGVYSVVKNCDVFDRDTLGIQMVRAADSVLFNIAEGYGRFSGSDNKQFTMYARGSLLELKAQLNVAGKRKLIQSQTLNTLKTLLAELIPMLIKYSMSVSKDYKK